MSLLPPRTRDDAADATEIAQFSRISIPLVRRVYPQLIADRLVSVQPLAQPSSVDFYTNFRYSEVRRHYPIIIEKVDWKREGF